MKKGLVAILVLIFAGFINNANAINCKLDCTQSKAKKVTESNVTDISDCLRECRGQGATFLKDIQNFMTTLLKSNQLGGYCAALADAFVQRNELTKAERNDLCAKAGGSNTPFYNCILKATITLEVERELAQERSRHRRKYGY